MIHFRYSQQNSDKKIKIERLRAPKIRFTIRNLGPNKSREVTKINIDENGFYGNESIGKNFSFLLLNSIIYCQDYHTFFV